MEIKTYTQNFAREIADLFHASVHAIDPQIYSDEQKEAWASSPIDYSFWEKRLNEKKPYLCMHRDKVVGFIELESDGYIGCTYTHPDYQGLGVASKMFEHLEAKAKEAKLDRLYVEASHVAVPFFKVRGFILIQENSKLIGGQFLTNFTMEKNLKG